MSSINKTLMILFLTFIFLLLSLEGQSSESSLEVRNWGIQKIEAQKTWKINQGQKIIVAIIDTGVDVTHPALQNQIWKNSKEIPNNGIDDDKNGFIDDMNGWNFVSNDNKLTDAHGHGTHIAGIIHAVAPQAQLMVLKYFDPLSLSDKNLTNTVKAIDYAIHNGAQIINYSGGGYGKDSLEEAAIQRAKEKGIIFIAAAGNERENSDQKPFYPASYNLSNIISVASLDQNSQLVESSNFGTRTVDIAAPGKNIISTLPGGRYGQMTGTSQATAFVTGAMAILLANQVEKKTPEELISNLVNTGNFVPSLNGKTKFRTKLNSYRALSMKGININASGFTAENTKKINNDIFSSDSSVVNKNIDILIQQMKSQEQVRIPAQQ